MSRNIPQRVQLDSASTRPSEQTCLERQPKRSYRPVASITKKPCSRVPPPQVERIKERHILGQSQREIARAEGRSRPTIAKIVKSEEMQAYVRHMRERYYGLGFDALDAVQHALQFRKDGQLGRQLLVDIGVAPSPGEIYAIASQPDKATLTPFEIAVAEDDQGQINGVAYGMACALEESARCFGTSLPTAEEYRHLREVATVADEMTGGRFLEICLSDGPEEKRIRRLGEQKVRCDEARRALPSRHVKRALPQRRQTAIVGPASNRN
jgi:hypothetical protein